MKKEKLLTGAVTVASVLLLSEFVSGFASANTTVDRYYYPNSGNHQWIPLNGRVPVPITGSNSGREGRAWTAPDSGTKVYELENPNTMDTLLTTSWYEANQVKKSGWVSAVYSKEPWGTSSWAFYSGGSVNIYRLYNPNSGKHHYTASSYESNSLVSAGWRLEGTALKAVGGA